MKINPTPFFLWKILAVFLLCISGAHAQSLGGILAVSFRDAPGATVGRWTHLKFPSWGQRTHLGNDVLVSCGSVIYAPGSGVIEDVVRPNTNNFNTLGNAVVIRHSGAGRGGADIFSLFLHMQDSPPVSIGDTVTAETIIGRVGTTGSSNGICHSHVELRYFSARFSQEYNSIYANGDVSQTSYAHDNWENPDQYILGIIPVSFFDGAGSLIDPTNSGNCAGIRSFGCTTDVVRLHPHGIPSTAVFQVLSQPGSCDYLEIGGLRAAFVSVKRWNETYPGNQDGLSTIYKVTSLPANLPLPANDWVLVSVTTTVPVPVDSYRDVTLTCKSGTFRQIAPGNQLLNVAPDVRLRESNPAPLLIPLGSDFYWSGSGSLITASGNSSTPSTINGYGRTRDEAIKLSSKKSLVSFQAFSDGTSCRTVRIFDAAGSEGQAVEASIKAWNSSQWGNATTGTLPLNLTLDGSGYFLIKIKPAAIGWLKIRAVCNG